MTVDQHRGDHARGNGGENEIVAGLHPVVAVRRRAQMMTTPVVDDIAMVPILIRQAIALIEAVRRAGAAAFMVPLMPVPVLGLAILGLTVLGLIPLRLATLRLATLRLAALGFAALGFAAIEICLGPRVVVRHPGLRVALIALGESSAGETE